MNNSMDATTSCLAIVEKKSHRPGGCGGIFFQLFDWNRRFAKKKLFSKKLLSPGRLKQASKKFGVGDDKKPKLRLIADENSGGFPTAKKHNRAIVNTGLDESNQTRTPSLVARLMGLESMPSTHREKSTKAPISGDKAHSFLDSSFRHAKEDIYMDNNREVKHVELRPQKVRKTSICDSLSITRSGLETLPLKSVLSRSRKHHHHYHHPKFPCPVKSPKNLGKKNSSRLIGAATRILEPGLQTYRFKSALTYSSTLNNPQRNSDFDDSNDFGTFVAKCKPSWQNRGHLPRHRDSDDHAPVDQSVVFSSPLSYCVEDSFQGSERSKHLRFDENFHDENPHFADCVMHNCQPCANITSNVSSSSEKTQRNSRSQELNPKLQNVQVPLNPDQDILWARDVFALRSKCDDLENMKESNAVIDELKNSDTDNQKLPCGTRSQPTVVTDFSEYISEKRTGLVPQGRKRRPTTNMSRQVDTFDPMSSVRNRQRYDRRRAISRKDSVYNPNSTSRQTCSRGFLPELQQRIISDEHLESNVVLSSFNSLVKQGNASHEPARRLIQENSLSRDNGSQKSSLKEKDQRTKVEQPSPINGDALSALLEQKLQELEGLENDTGEPKKTTAMILNELISALTLDTPIKLDQPEATSGGNSQSFSKSPFSRSTSSSNLPVSIQTNAMSVKPSTTNQPVHTEQLSPSSVLEAYFSSSIDESIGDKMQTESVDHGSESLLPDTKLEHSAASRTTAENNTQLVKTIFNQVSEILCCNNLAYLSLKGDKLNQAKEVLLNAELICQTAAHSAAVVENDPIKLLLCDELEALARVLGTEACMDMNKLKIFALDTVIEYLDLRFGGYDRVRSKVSMKLPLRINTKSLISDITEEVRGWKQLAMYVSDDLIEKEMSTSLQEWTLFEIEGSETCVEISMELLQVLVDEIITDLCSLVA